MGIDRQPSDAATAGRMALRDTFDQAASCYDEHAALEQEVGCRLLERCGATRREPERILDLGCGTGAAAASLKQRYRRAKVMGLDLSPAMLARLKRRSRLLRPLIPVCGDLAALPFAASAFDLLFANLADPWTPDRTTAYDEYRRVLRPGGLLLFSTFGPGTLRELAAVASDGRSPLALPEFPDLLALGDALVRAGFTDPVMDRESLTLEYRDLGSLVRELEATGSSLLVEGWSEWAGQPASLDAARTRLERGGRYPVSFEIVYGTAFGPEEGQPRRTPDGEVATISVDSLLKSRRIS